MSKNVLVLAAHPDDETLGCGATIARLSNEGYSVQLLTFTDGVGSRGENSNRNDVLKSVQNVLGLSSYSYGNFPDNKMDSVPLLDVCKFIENNVTTTPDIIFTHHRGCLNVDHQIVYKATLTAFRPQLGNNTKILSYYVPSSTDYNIMNFFLGNVHYNVVNYKDIKLKCLKECYDKEMRKYPHTRSYENVENLMKVWGSEVGLEYAEKFELVRQVL